MHFEQWSVFYCCLRLHVIFENGFDHAENVPLREQHVLGEISLYRKQEFSLRLLDTKRNT